MWLRGLDYIRVDIWPRLLSVSIVCVRTWACESGGDWCVTGDGGPCSHSSPIERQRRSAIHPHLARQSQPTGMCEVQTHTHTHTGQAPALRLDTHAPRLWIQYHSGGVYTIIHMYVHANMQNEIHTWDTGVCTRAIHAHTNIHTRMQANKLDTDL